ncbi:MAG: hypothetical protein FWD34_09885 [Oscillospiraceae bacterium]|nr:hypothetical protein [Oscillospiraceae bacterium]
MKHERFIYHSYEITADGFSFRFTMDEYEFTPQWKCDIPETDDLMLHELVFNLGLVELISYWKSACPPIVEVRCGSLDDWQINWWKKLYLNGLGEFFYINNITPADDFMTIIPTQQHRPKLTVNYPLSTINCLTPVGGGKDSIVTLELLKEYHENNHCYIIGNIQRAYDTAKTAGYSDDRIIRVSRTIDPVLLELNKKGYLNGHTPFSAIVAFSSLVFAYITGKKYIVLSNESSANEGNTDSGVNHQYSKSTEFERDFREYVSRISPDLPEYFSLLRPLNELQITERFVQFPKYFPIFQSCNAGTKTNTWCRKCAKCLYVYIMLAAFLDDETLISIFGENLLENPELSDILTALKNPDYDKPFECVGTREEVNTALDMISGKPNYPRPGLLDCFNDDNFVPKELIKLLKG